MSEPTRDDIDRLAAGRTLPGEFVKAIDRYGERTALRWRDEDDSWGEWTYHDYADRAARVTTGLRGLGVRPGDRVALMLRNRPEFHAADIAALMCRATPVSIYNSSAPEQIEYLVNHCGAKVAIVDDVAFLERFLKVRDQLRTLEHLLVVDDPAGAAPADVGSFGDLLAAEPADLTAAAAEATPEDLATVIYTSGTTGPPKGVLIDQHNVVWVGEALIARLVPYVPDGKRVVSYLPMAHIAERTVTHYWSILMGHEVTSCPDPGRLASYLTDARPNIVFGVPRVWEKLHAGVEGALAADPERKKSFDDAVEASRPLAVRKAHGEALTDEEQATADFLDEVAFAPVRELLGLDHCEMAVTGAAPITTDLLTWFRAIGVPLAEVYGMSENTGAMTFDLHRIKAGTVGRALPGVEVFLADDGEVLCRGGLVFGGYLNAPDKTAEALDEDGTLHTGDIGELDDEGYLRIVDRKKELIITAGGKNISPANLESELKSIPLIGQACAIGDQRKFMSALLVLDPDVAPGWAAQHDIEDTSLPALAGHPDVLAEVQRGVDAANAGFNNTERIKKFTLLGEEWLPDSDLLTPTSKLKRRGIHARYEAEIEAMYAG